MTLENKSSNIVNEIFEPEVRRKWHNLSIEKEKELAERFPDKKYFEFVFDFWFKRSAKNFSNLSDDFDRWLPSRPWDIDDLVRYRHMILDNEEMIKDKKVADVGSHLGFGSLLSLHIGAERVVGLEPYELKNKLASLICQKAGYQNHTFITGELKREDFYNQITGFDTAILGSLIDMIPSHYQLIQNIASTGVKNIIIEMEDRENSTSETPSVEWRNYGNDHVENHGPLNRHRKVALHGFPNLSFLKMLLGEFGYRLQKTAKYKDNTYMKTPKNRSTSVFVLEVDETGKDVNLKND